MSELPAMKVRALGRVVIRILLVLAVTIAVGEGVVRVFDIRRELKFDVDPELYWRARPSQAGYVWGGNDRVRSPEIWINEDGIRDRDRLARQGDRLTLLALGDSYTFGWGVEEDEAFVTVLEREHGAPLRVLNAGVPGYGLFQIVALNQRLLPIVRPQAVLVTLTTGDVYRQPIEDAAQRERVLRDYAWVAAMQRGGRFVGLAYRGARNIFRRLRGDVSMLPTQVGANDIAGFREWWNRDSARLRKMAELCRQSGVQLIVLAWPNWNEPSQSSLKRGSDAVVAEGLKELSREVPLIPLLGLGALLENHPLRELTIPIDDHPSPLAHRIAGEYLASELRGLLGADAKGPSH